MVFIADLSAHEVALRYVFAGMSTIGSTVVTNCVDVAKTRLQVQSKSPYPTHYRGVFHALAVIMREEGVRGYYKGFMSASLREGTYSSLRIGMYEPTRDLLCGPDSPLDENSVLGRVLAGVLSGGFAASLTTPTDVLRVRYQCAGPGTQPPYTSLWDGFRRIYAQGGVAALYRGGNANTIRAMVLTGSQVPSYDVFKRLIKESGHLEEGKALHFSASVAAGLVCSLTTSPVDTIKSLYMNDRTGMYKSMFDCAVQATKRDTFALYRGFFAQWLRIAPHTIVTFVLLEQLRKAFGLSAI